MTLHVFELNVTSPLAPDTRHASMLTPEVLVSVEHVKVPQKVGYNNVNTAV